MKDVLDTMYYIDMVIGLTKSQPGPTYEIINGQPAWSRSFLIHSEARTDIILAVNRLGSLFSGIVETHEQIHSGQDYHLRLEARRPEVASVKHQPAYVDQRSAQSRRLGASDLQFMHWNAVVREFHEKLHHALRSANVNSHLQLAIMKNIPVKWVTAEDKEGMGSAWSHIFHAGLSSKCPLMLKDQEER
ncbi:hypothetical protein FZEAL_5632 [Fusarium zealandicum]|uniref:Uncharacterized protein n=1 Tax=Fusarium zealandicum TaxID=1053134 RepID=A0A8H4UK47_9HYPO|nr:hypothetical protein FZEAL_5632 [Fusarium zealandicum]